MIHFTTIIKKFASQGEKTGWTYIDIPSEIATQLKPGCKTSFMVKGSLDLCVLSQVSLLPMGEGNFIIPLNAAIRKKIKKVAGAPLAVSLEADDEPYLYNNDLMACLADEPAAGAFFSTLTGSHKKYFSKWIDSAKTESTKAKRIARTVYALSRGLGYPEMIKLDREML